jgi:hypothetical protein
MHTSKCPFEAATCRGVESLIAERMSKAVSKMMRVDLPAVSTVDCGAGFHEIFTDVDAALQSGVVERRAFAEQQNCEQEDSDMIDGVKIHFFDAFCLQIRAGLHENFAHVDMAVPRRFV